MDIAHLSKLTVTLEDLAWVRFGGDLLEISGHLRDETSTPAFFAGCVAQDRLRKLRSGGLAHIRETHYAATQILSPCNGGLQPGQELRQSVFLMNVTASARFESSSHHFRIRVSGQK